MSTAISSAITGSLTSSAANTSSAISSSANTAVNNATNSFDELNKQIAALQEKADQKKLTVEDFRKDTNDVLIDNKMTARDIGTLKDHKTRLNLFSALSTNDGADVFRFKVDKTATTKIGVLTANAADQDSVRIQIFSRKTGRLVADNDPKSKDLQAAYDKLQHGDLELDKGDYILRISRQDGVDPRLKKSFSYALQLSQGTFTQDYDTVEQAKATDSSDPYGLGSVGVSTTNLIGGLTDAYSFITSLPRIGTSATDKLSGLMLDALS
jgi:hypothetical protein